ncbi:MAG: Zn-dependent hydrolase [Actinomycetales bacterium]|nr:MAG: Zn-dependent hydrolase [Actinomycetales bacterium]
MSAYAGHVTPGGPSQVRELSRLVLRKCSVGELDNNVYLLTCRATGKQLLVDAADDPARLKSLVAEGAGRLGTILTTHRHYDHVRALAELAAWSGATTLAGAEDADALPVAPDRRLGHGDHVQVGEITLDVVHLRGHTEGGIALAYADPEGITHLITGDSLFPGGIGNTNMPGQSFDQLYADVTERIFDVYDDDTWFYPGHGDDSTLGAERPHLAEWLERGW